LKKLIIKGMDKRYFSDKIVKWYLENMRNLPWRQTNDPYKIWLSEIILQQTRVNQGLPYYLKFIEHYPTVSDLAHAPEQQVLRLWQGLGYYTRARNLHKCAKVIAEKYNGRFPQTYAELLTLPGVGEYTAAAIASIAFKEKVAVVDGNVFRVLSRIFGVDTTINSPDGKKTFSALANELMPYKQPDIHNQAVMEFGALYCTPKNPVCNQCIYNPTCFAFKNSLQQSLPVKLKSKASRKRYFYYLVFQYKKSLLMRNRKQKDIWLGLHDFPMIETTRSVKAEKIISELDVIKKLNIEADKYSITDTYKHVLTHQTIFARFIVISVNHKVKWHEPDVKFHSFKQVLGLPKPVLVSKFLADRYLL
jgi:A/G-specific adenine glycosylase